MSGEVKRLKRVLTELGGEQVRTDGKFAFYAVPDAKNQVPVPIKTSTDFSHAHYKLAADALGITTGELRDLMDKRVPQRNGPGVSTTSYVSLGPTKGDVVEALAAFRKVFADFERDARKGQRDPAAYAHFYAMVRDAATCLSRPMPGQRGGDVTPVPVLDDKGYRPTRLDPVLTGVARATGETAKAVRRGAAATKWEHDGRPA